MTLFHLGELASGLEHFEQGIDLYDVRKRNFQRALQDPGSGLPILQGIDTMDHGLSRPSS